MVPGWKRDASCSFKESARVPAVTVLVLLVWHPILGGGGENKDGFARRKKCEKQRRLGVSFCIHVLHCVTRLINPLKSDVTSVQRSHPRSRCCFIEKYHPSSKPLNTHGGCIKIILCLQIISWGPTPVHTSETHPLIDVLPFPRPRSSIDNGHEKTYHQCTPGSFSQNLCLRTVTRPPFDVTILYLTQPAVSSVLDVSHGWSVVRSVLSNALIGIRESCLYSNRQCAIAGMRFQG